MTSSQFTEAAEMAREAFLATSEGQSVMDVVNEAIRVGNLPYDDKTVETLIVKVLLLDHATDNLVWPVFAEITGEAVTGILNHRSR